jgi:hypothetical protein
LHGIPVADEHAIQFRIDVIVGSQNLLGGDGRPFHQDKLKIGGTENVSRLMRELRLKKDHLPRNLGG